jgi:MSHA biogenesis protein MshJ
VKSRIVQLVSWLDALNPRERLMVLGAGLAALLSMWSLLASPLEARLASASSRAAAAAARAEAAAAENGALLERLAADPAAAQRKEERRLQVEVETLRMRERELVGALVTPEESAGLLRELLDASPELRVVRLDAGSPSPLGESGLFEHEIEVEIEGGFASVVGWLEALEALPWRLRGEELHYEVLDWPRAKVLLRLFTLSIEETWIRA